MDSTTLARSRRRRARRFTLFVAALGAWLAPASFDAAPRDHVFEWVPPAGTVGGYRVLLGRAPTLYDQIVDLGFVSPDPDGVGRATLTLDSTRDYYVAMTAYNDAGESPHSNEEQIAASACDPTLCDDAQQCTADDCGTSGCTHAPLPDGTLCTDPDGAYAMCLGGVCQLAQCTDASHCNDGNACNGVESCSLTGSCTAGIAPSCGEPTQCAVPSCDPTLGCVSNARADGTPCDDGRRNTINDVCRSGVCRGTHVRRYK